MIYVWGEDWTVISGHGHGHAVVHGPSKSGSTGVAIDFATVTVSATNPTASASGSVTVTPGFATVTISATSPTVSSIQRATPDFATVAVSATGPNLIQIVTPDAALVTVSGTSPTAVGSGVASAVVPGFAEVVITGYEITTRMVSLLPDPYRPRRPDQESEYRGRPDQAV